MLKILLLATLFIFSITTFPTQTEANSDYPKRPAITIINPLRGHQLGLEGADLLASLKEQWLLTNNLNANATWLWQYSALEEKEMVDFAKKEMRNQEFGIFLEIDKNFAEKSDIRYKGHGPWYFSDGLFLTSYDKFERKKIIDNVFEKFKQKFGYYPKTVGAWWVGAESIEYMQKKYQIVAVLQCADQFATDAYSIWGTPWSIPYIPAKNNSAIPAQSLSDKSNNVVVLQWATRDPLRAYGNSVEHSTYSVQDYALKNYDTNYYKFLSQIFLKKPYDQTVIGLEGGLPTGAYKGLYLEQIKTAKKWEQEGHISIQLAEQYASDFLKKGEILPPTRYFLTKDFETADQAFWYNSPRYRLGIQKINNEIFLIDFRDYSATGIEDFYSLPNTQPLIRINTKSIIDSVRFPTNRLLIAESTESLKTTNDKDKTTLYAGDKKLAEMSENYTQFKSIDKKSTEKLGPIDKSDTYIFNFSQPVSFNKAMTVMIILFSSYLVLLFSFIKDKKSIILNLSTVMVSLIIAYPIITSGSLFSREYLFDERFISLIKMGRFIFTFSPEIKILIIYQVFPLIVILTANYILSLYYTKNRLIYPIYFILVFTLLLKYTGYLHWLFSFFHSGLKAKLIGAGILFSLGAYLGILLVLFKKHRIKTFYILILLTILSLLLISSKSIRSEKRIIIAPFEMNALNSVFQFKRQVLFISHKQLSVVENYHSVKPLLFVDFHYGEFLSGVKWEEVSQFEQEEINLTNYKNKLLFLPLYLGANIYPDDKHKYGLLKKFDNAQIELYTTRK